MTTHFNPVFTVKVPSEPAQTLANCAVTIFCAVSILFNWGKMEGVESLTGVFQRMMYVINTRSRSTFTHACPYPWVAHAMPRGLPCGDQSTRRRVLPVERGIGFLRLRAWAYCQSPSMWVP